MLKTVLIAAMLAVAAPAAAQPASPKEAMAPFKPLIGRWEGAGWIVRQGGRDEFIGRETISERLGGAAVLVEGRHLAKNNPDMVVHDALAVIAWSPREKAYRFRSNLATGQSGDYPMTVEPGKFTWTLTTPDGGKVEYVTIFDDKSWKETGRFSRDGATWVPIFEMTLKKVP